LKIKILFPLITCILFRIKYIFKFYIAFEKKIKITFIF
jgi:hypothetical protein